MRILLVTLCLTIAVLLAGSLSSAEASDLKPCPSGKYFTWHMCFGTHTFVNGDQYMGEWKHGKMDGDGILFKPYGIKSVGIWMDNRLIKRKQLTEKWYKRADEEKAVLGIAKKMLEKKRLAREKKERIAKEKREKERLAREEKQRIAKEKREAELNRIEKERISRNPGFKDLKPGLRKETIGNMGVCGRHLTTKWTTCYGIDNMKFAGEYSKGFLQVLTIDFGPIVDTGFLSQISSYVDSGQDANIFTKTKSMLDKKYKKEFAYSERDRQLFNENEKQKLYVVYNKGQVALLILKVKKSDWETDLVLRLQYRDVEAGLKFLENTRPVRAQDSDF